MFQIFRRARSKQIKEDEESGIGTFISKSIDKINDDIDEKEGKKKGKGYFRFWLLKIAKVGLQIYLIFCFFARS